MNKAEVQKKHRKIPTKKSNIEIPNNASKSIQYNRMRQRKRTSTFFMCGTLIPHISIYTSICVANKNHICKAIKLAYCFIAARRRQRHHNNRLIIIIIIIKNHYISNANYSESFLLFVITKIIIKHTD